MWGTGILFELSYVLPRIDAARGTAGGEERAARLLAQMESAFPGATVHAPKAHYPYALNDPDDSHVAHAAIFGKADAVVTDDRRAGLATNQALQDANVEVLRSSDFVANTVAAHPLQARNALTVMSRRFANPRMSEIQVLETLRDRYSLTEAFDLLAAEFYS